MGSSSASSCGAKRPLAHKRRKQRQRQKQAKPNGEKEHRVAKRLPEHGSAPQLPEILQPRKVRVRHPCVNVKNTLTANGTA